MNDLQVPPTDPRPSAWWVVASGALALAVAMGIGRFAFTPLMPLMLRDGSLSAAQGAEWAAANYLGYLLGALSAPRFARQPQRGLRTALYGVALSTLAIAGIGDGLPIGVGTLLRTAAGIFSAWALVCTSTWCLGELAQRQLTRLGAWLYTGVGAGIALAGVFAWLGGRQPAQWLWGEFGLLALAGAALVGRSLRGPPATPTRPGAMAADEAAPTRARSPLGLVLCYGSFGFGYIVPATFLPALARQQVDDPLVFGLTWPLFGLAAALSVAGAARWLSHWPRRRVWALAQGGMAVGTALPVATPALWSLAASAVFVGGTFMVTTMAGLQMAREQAPANPTPLLARMTVAFALGQILGPLLVRALGAGRWLGGDAMAWVHMAATVLLVGTSVWLWRGASKAPSEQGRGT